MHCRPAMVVTSLLMCCVCVAPPGQEGTSRGEGHAGKVWLPWPPGATGWPWPPGWEGLIRSPRATGRYCYIVLHDAGPTSSPPSATLLYQLFCLVAIGSDQEPLGYLFLCFRHCTNQCQTMLSWWPHWCPLHALCQFNLCQLLCLLWIPSPLIK